MGENRQNGSFAKRAEYIDLESASDSERSLKTTEKVYLTVMLAVLIASAALLFIVGANRSSDFELVVAPASSEYDLSVINEATLEDFMQINGIGEVKANSIVNFRDSIGGFTDINQLTYLDGISDKTLEKIIEYFYGEGTD